MADPLDKATAKAPPEVGEGCTRRYDPEALSEDDGTEFPGAEALWQQEMGEQEPQCCAAAKAVPTALKPA